MPSGDPGTAPDRRPTLVCITQPDLAATNDILQAACASRAVDFIAVTAGSLKDSPFLDRQGPRLLYRAATDTASAYLEKLLYGPRVAAFHDPQFTCDHPAITLQRAGLPVAPKVFLPASDADALAAQVDWLGGFPLVVKRPGTEGGRGVLLIERWEDLGPALETAPAGVLLEAFVPHRKAYRLLVVGREVVACTAAAPGAGDFRSNVASAQDLGPVPPPGDAAAIACKATAALRLELGGVDLLEADDGTLFVSEVNCPCYFADQQQATGRDLAGMMVDHLLAKSKALLRGL